MSNAVVEINFANIHNIDFSIQMYMHLKIVGISAGCCSKEDVVVCFRL